MTGVAKPAAIWMLPLFVVLLALTAILVDPAGVVTTLRGVQFDTYQRQNPRPYTDTLKATGYAVKTIDFAGTGPDGAPLWPLGHAGLARLVNALGSAGAAVVVLDLPLDIPDPMSPEALARGLPPGTENDPLRAALKRLPSPDADLARALAAVHAVTGASLTPDAGAAFASKTKLQAPSPAALAAAPGYGGAAMPVPPVQRASAGLGGTNLAADSDGRLRGVPMILRIGGKAVPSLDAAVMQLIAGEPLAVETAASGPAGLPGAPELSRLSAGGLSVPLRADGQMMIWFSGANPAHRISAAALEAGTVAAGSLARTIVYIAPPHQLVPTPLGPESLAALHAEAMENILLGVPLRQADSLWGELFFLAFSGIALALIARRFGLLWAGSFTLVAVAVAQGFTWMLFTRSHVLFDSINPSLALIAAFAAAALARLYQIAAGRAMLRQTFAGALAKPALDRIARTPALLKGEGEARVVTCLSCGIRFYAELAESFADDPAGLNRLIATLMPPLVDAATAHGALVDCVTAGGFNAYWNVPLADGEHAIHACEAASRMTVVLAEVNEQLSRERRFDGTAYAPIEIGIGLATGKAAAGTFPLGGHLHYAINGDCTVLADRIRDLSGRYGPAIIVSDETRNAASRGFAFLEVDFLALGGRSEPAKLFALLGNPVVRASPKFRALATFHEHIFQSLRTQQWDKSRELIDQCRKLSGASQKLYDLHLARIEWYEKHPPGADWDGAFREAVQ